MLFHVSLEFTVGIVTMELNLANVANSYGADMLVIIILKMMMKVARWR